MKNGRYNFPQLKVSSYILFCLANGPKPIQFTLMYDKGNDSNAHEKLEPANLWHFSMKKILKLVFNYQNSCSFFLI